MMLARRNEPLAEVMKMQLEEIRKDSGRGMDAASNKRNAATTKGKGKVKGGKT